MYTAYMDFNQNSMRNAHKDVDPKSLCALHISILVENPYVQSLCAVHIRILAGRKGNIGKYVDQNPYDET